jgi:hypothetical protein
MTESKSYLINAGISLVIAVSVVISSNIILFRYYHINPNQMYEKRNHQSHIPINSVNNMNTAEEVNLYNYICE